MVNFRQQDNEISGSVKQRFFFSVAEGPLASRADLCPMESAVRST